jgi:hypothetical protein
MGILDTLVKLASLGTSGVCIFAIFWSGWLISRPETSKDVDKQKTLRLFMLFCVVILLISAATGFWSGHIDKNQIAELNKKIEEYKTQNRQYRVVGFLKKDDGSDPGDVIITTQYPAIVPDFEGKILGLSVVRDESGRLPALGFTCPGYGPKGQDLNELTTTQNNTIELPEIILHKIPGK